MWLWECMKAIFGLLLLVRWNQDSLVAQPVKNPPAIQEIPVRFLGREDPLKKLPTPVFLGFAGGSDGRESASNAGDLDSILGLGRCPGRGYEQVWISKKSEDMQSRFDSLRRVWKILLLMIWENKRLRRRNRLFRQ